jgi:hypothetical protein
MCRNLALSTGKSLNILSSFKASLIMVVEVSRLRDFAVMMKFQSSSFPARSEACEERRRESLFWRALKEYISAKMVAIPVWKVY